MTSFIYFCIVLSSLLSGNLGSSSRIHHGDSSNGSFTPRTLLVSASRKFYLETCQALEEGRNGLPKNAAIRDSEVLHKLHLLPSRLIKKYSILHTISREEMGQSQQEANQTTLHKGNTGYLKNSTTRAHSVLGTDSLAPLRRQELCSQDLKPQLPRGP